MANPTTYFGWVMPTSSSLVTNLPADFNTFGQGVDTSLQDLLGGTTGQVLSKASGTNMDFSWVTPTDQTPLTTKGDLFAFSTLDARLPAGANETRLVADSAQTLGLKYVADTTNYAIAAKGDLLAGTAADTLQALTVGNNGETLVADSSTSTGLRYQGNYAAGKNEIINGDFRINQRAFTSTTTAGYNFDRWQMGFSGGTVTASTQAFTAGTAPVVGYEGTNFARLVSTSQSASGDYAAYWQPIESVRTFANQTVTVSFWAKASTGTPNIGVTMAQSFGSGGSSTVVTSPAVQAITTSWVRYTFNVNVPSISGKTIGAGDYLATWIMTSVGTGVSGSGYAAVGVQNATIDIWGVQVEAGSTATAFQTATGTIQGELAACQRYYQKSYAQGTTVPTNSTLIGSQALANVSVADQAFIGYQYLPVVMRIAPTVTIYSYTSSTAARVSNGNGTDLAANSGLAGGIADRGYYVYNGAGSSISAANGGYLFHYQASAEL